ncbi:MAG: DUF4349 domain-containing protein, partial [Anaerolineaceae bacterium]|nr:DUF4349 domain-containing protein [Anaerolineaceae bacterium]
LIALSIFSLLLAACASAAPKPEQRDQMQVVAEQGYAPAMVPPMVSADALSKGTGSAEFIEAVPADGIPGADRVVIKNASITIIVADPVHALSSVGNMAEGMGGFIVSSNLYIVNTNAGREVPEGYITVRVPADRLKESLEQIKALVVNPKEDIRSENISGTDVTREYTDLKSRLKNLEHAQVQLTDIMTEARRTEDVLAVYNELMRITEQIEVLKGQIQYYDEAALLSAITVSIISKETVAPLTIAGWQPVGIARDAIQALINALQTLAEGLIWLTLFCLPIGVLLAIPIYFISKGVRRWVAKRKVQKAGATSPADSIK